MTAGASQRVEEKDLDYPPDRILKWPRSDGDPSHKSYPSRMVERVSSDGQVDWFRVIPKLERSHVDWRRKVGNYLAKEVDGRDTKKEYIMNDFPEHYTFFDHNKGPREGPRHDVYLYGSRTVLKFRSPNEFLPHAKWLYDQNSTEPCKCKYCGKTRSQTSITATLGKFASGNIRVGGVGGRGLTGQKPGVRRIVSSAKSGLPKQTVSRDRNSDLTSTRHFRVAEIVWCALDAPAGSEDPSDHSSIDFWPGIVVEVRFNIHVEPHDPGQRYSVSQTHAYKVKLLGVMHAHLIPEDKVLPYQAYIPPDDMIDRLREIKIHLISSDLRELHAFQPIQSPLNELGRDGSIASSLQFKNAAAPYALALQIAAQISSFWCPTDQWKFIPGTTSNPSPKQPIQSPTDGTFASTSAAPPPETRISRSSVELRYQGLWWGSERIWMDDLVRIKPTRASLHATTAAQLNESTDPSSIGRCLFLRINSIFVEDGPPKSDGTTPKECKVAGMLYETVSIDRTFTEANGKVMESLSSVVGSSPLRPPTLVTPTSSSPIVNHITNDTPASSSMSSSHRILSPEISDPFILSDNLSSSAQAYSHLISRKQSSSTSEPWTYRLPTPPPGYVFHPILPITHEIVLPIDMLAGRYYPPSSILSNPLLSRTLSRDRVQEYADTPEFADVQHLFSLGGINPGWVCAMECKTFKGGGRREMMNHGDMVARQLLYDFWKGEESAVVVKSDDNGGNMDVDGDVDMEIIDLTDLPEQLPPRE